MSPLKQVAEGLRNIWGHADDEDDYAQDEVESQETTPEPHRETRKDSYDRHVGSHSASGQASSTAHTPSYGGGPYGGGASSGSHLRKLRPVANPLRSVREKNIYTLKPKSMDEVSLAADYLKTGCAVVLNLDDVERLTAVRIIDFMSGVCYGLENEGHAMKLGQTIFLFTPGDFEISSDETDYAENRDIIFKDISEKVAARAEVAPPQAPLPATASYGTSASRPWDR